jgi:hypothetical protein
LPLAVGDCGGRLPHMAHDDEGQQREGNKRHRDKRYEADDHRPAWLLRPPRQADHRLSLAVGQCNDLIVAGRRRRVDQAEALDLQMIANLGQEPMVDIFDQCYDRRARISVRRIWLLTNRYRGNNGGLAQKILKKSDRFGRLG